MEKLNEEQLRNLKWGDKVYKFDRDSFRGLYFVGKMPKGENYLIFCDGEYITYLYISKDGSFQNEWYAGEYDSKFVGELKLAQLRKTEESIRKIYFKE